MGSGMIAVLFYNEDVSLIPHQRRLIDAWCAMAGMTHIMVDKTLTLKQTNGNVFHTIQDAISSFPECEFIFLTEKAEKTLKDYHHTEENVIYCFGSDDDGFQDLDLNDHLNYKLQRLDGTDNEWYAATILPIVIADRMVRL